MPSSIQVALRSSHIDRDDDRPRSASSSSTSRSSVPSSQQSGSRRSETPKVKRKTLSNRTAPYNHVPASHSIGSTASTIQFDDETENSNTNMSQASLSANLNTLSMNTSTDPLPVQTIVSSSSANGPFEKSSDDERDVSYPIVVSMLFNRLLTMNICNSFADSYLNSFADSYLSVHRKALMSNRRARPER